MSKQPNIVFIFSDQQHWQALSFQDKSFHTPHQAALAEESTIFHKAFCSTPQCSPSRSSLLTGFYPSKTGVMGNIGFKGGDNLQMDTIGVHLQKAGYRTAYFGKWHLGSDEKGMAGWHEAYGIAQEEKSKDEEVTRRAVDFLYRHDGDGRPFALFLSYKNPHDIYEFYHEQPHQAPQADPNLPKTWHEKDLSTVPPMQQQFMNDDQGHVIVGKAEESWQRYREIYRGKNTLYDSEMGTVLNYLRENNYYDKSFIITTSDHGDMDTQHKLIFKGPFMYEHMMRVPLMMKLPKSLQTEMQPVDSDFPTVNVDLVPTILDYAGIESVSCDGKSLRPILEGVDVALPDFVVTEYYGKQKWVNPARQIRTARYKYTLYKRMHNEENLMELYDMEADPEEIHNLAYEEASQSILEELHQKLCVWIEEQNDQFFSFEPTQHDGSSLASV